MPGTHSDSVLRFIAAGLNLGWVRTAPQAESRLSANSPAGWISVECEQPRRLILGWVRTAPQAESRLSANSPATLQQRIGAAQTQLRCMLLESHPEWDSLTQCCATFRVWTCSGASQQPVRQYAASFHHVDEEKSCILLSWYFATDHFQKTFEVCRSHPDNIYESRSIF
jgi:hypothetical protein